MITPVFFSLFIPNIQIFLPNLEVNHSPRSTENVGLLLNIHNSPQLPHPRIVAESPIPENNKAKKQISHKVSP